MAEAEEKREKRYISRDLFMKGGNFGEIRDENEDIELSLGLSLNGRFGVDPQRAKRLKRSSSITNFVFSNERLAFPVVGSYAPIARTCSLPVEAEEECRKRKELQSLRRSEAKRKRMEKLQNGRVVSKVDLAENLEENGNGYSNGNGKGNSLPLSQGSMGSQGSGSSGISDFGSQPIQGRGDNSTEANTPASIKPSEHEQKQVATETTNEKPPSSISGSASKGAKEMLKNFMSTMPCVSTTGDGPNGKKIEGFLYRYSKGEEVKIVCVCHGDFLSPTEFVKHAGGGNVANPLRHIVVNPSPLTG